ncbi:hypothetical protein CLAFUW4_03810 [Fulvia fulva]|uniref:Uncharacterized protein n=1 Tax=Passalora fulva TaxID=5499 RepID=A0A9Q8P546_PASFU|nr:uncharacterized protein CLAFUR5_03782 [Fulvia fulva]KAK4631424.1 hypothetical protein CLAFUR4_03798 [Fulvia fulva]KAK4633589.1 hypothetical protein CLAFUR0_03797 [Fulvia fulva]UJO13382.1 hypothetical protein CLAFUR5_03782 [Fulvia fulva]WPV11781.1 hypothetical protein CLAFUW4_03810 [Fulvia fulva]WPV25983.1 hypothetical protein CLAFUW7_03802 [Fulvia fulva]
MTNGVFTAGGTPLAAPARVGVMSAQEARAAMPPPPRPDPNRGLPTMLKDFTLRTRGPPSHYFNGTLLPTDMSGASGVQFHSNKDVEADQVWPGKIIWAPNHATALDPSAYYKAGDAMNPNFGFIDNAVICSKRRPMIVLWSYPWALFALPCGTKGHTGLSKVSNDEVWRSYLCVRDSRIQQDAFQDDGVAKAVVAHMRESANVLDQFTVVDVTNAQIVNLKDKIQLGGHLDWEDTVRLTTLWHEYTKQAMSRGNMDRKAAKVP